MSIDPDAIEQARRRNEEKAGQEAERGPARAEPDAAPIGDAIRAYHERGDVTFGIPAHRSDRTSAGVPAAAAWAGADAFRSDLAMDKGIDTRHQSWQVEPTAMQLFADAVGADQTLFSTNGSSQNVHVAMLAAVHPGEQIVMARNGHKSAFAALVLSGAWPVYVDPVYDDEHQVAHAVEPDALARALDSHPEARAALVFTPSYYGVGADVRALADVCHSRDVPLITDDAWGLDYSFCSRLPASSISSGADLAIGSVHKTLSGLGQTSVMSRKGTRIDPDRLQLVFELEQSTSASSLLLSSIDAARREFQLHGEELLGAAIDRAHALRERIAAIDGLDLMPTPDMTGRPGIFSADPTHVSFDVTALGITGFSAVDWLREHRGVHVELGDHRRIMVIVTYADDDASIERLASALQDLARDPGEADRGGLIDVPRPGELRMETVLRPRDAFLGRTELVDWSRAAGRVSAEMVCPYPPGVPIAAPGERLTPVVVEYLEHLSAAGVMVEGAADESLRQLRVVAA